MRVRSGKPGNALAATLALAFALVPAFAGAEDTELTGIWRGTVPELSSPDPCKPWFFAKVLIDAKGDGMGRLEFIAFGSASADAPIATGLRVAPDGTYSGIYSDWDGTRDISGKLDRAEASFTWHNPHGCSYGGMVKKTE